MPWLAAVRLRLWKLLWPLRARRQKDLSPGSRFPDFSLDDAAGQTHSLSDDPGGGMTVLWFTNLCEDCRSQIPLLNELTREAADRFRVLAVSLLDREDPLPAQITADCAFPLLLDPEDVTARELGLTHPPGACPLNNLFIVGPDGRILRRGHLSALGPDRFRSLWRKLKQKP